MEKWSIEIKGGASFTTKHKFQRKGIKMKIFQFNREFFKLPKLLLKNINLSIDKCFYSPAPNPNRKKKIIQSFLMQ